MKTYHEFEKGKHVLLDTYNRNYEEQYDAFKEYCEDNGYTIEGEDDDMVGLYLGGKITFYDWYSDNLSYEIEEFWSDFRKAIENEPNYTRCLITGVVGRWDGKHELGINLCDDLYAAVSKCLKYADDAIIYLEDNVLHVEEYNHDGSSEYKIRLVNSDNYDKLENWDDDVDGDFTEWMKNPNNFNKFYWDYFGMA